MPEQITQDVRADWRLEVRWPREQFARDVMLPDALEAEADRVGYALRDAGASVNFWREVEDGRWELVGWVDPDEQEG